MWKRLLDRLRIEMVSRGSLCSVVTIGWKRLLDRLRNRDSSASTEKPRNLPSSRWKRLLNRLRIEMAEELVWRKAAAARGRGCSPEKSR